MVIFFTITTEYNYQKYVFEGFIIYFTRDIFQEIINSYNQVHLIS